jgi:predicted ATPase
MTTAFKLRHISIKDYKGIDHLELDFPAPDLPGDPDVFVIGSENGLGKTSVLECCALSLFMLKLADSKGTNQANAEHFNLLVRAGKSQAEITGRLTDKTKTLVRINENSLSAGVNPSRKSSSESQVILVLKEGRQRSVSKTDTISKILGQNPNPAIEKEFMLFHSYRKIYEGNLRAKSLFGSVTADTKTSIFKHTALFSIMSHAGLFDIPKYPNTQETLIRLDDLLKEYADCRLSKLRPTRNDSLEVRVQPIGGSETFNFDGLSSGQKEIITTLFLIWHETRNQPKVVLIDEPELHLNSQWHRSFINSLTELAPQNQYIIATHSATIMDSVNRNRRILLQKDKETVQ